MTFFRPSRGPRPARHGVCFPPGMAWTAALLLLAGLDTSGQDAPPPGPYKADFRLSVDRRDGEWVFSVEGTTDLPREAEIRVRIYAVEIVQDPRRGRREDEEPLVWEDDERQTSYAPVEIGEDGRFRKDVYRFRREPWALLYRARLHYLPRFQTEDAVLRKMGADELSWHADFRYGDDETYAKQMVERVTVVTDEIAALERLYEELQREYARQRKRFQGGGWKAWKNGWFAKVEELKASNEERYSLWSVWMERQAKMRIGGMCELLRRILVGCQRVLVDETDAEKRGQAAERVDDMIAGFYEYYEEAIEVIGLRVPLPTEKVRPILEDYDAAFAPLAEALEKDPPAVDGKVYRAARQGCLEALMQLPPLLKTRKSAYRFANELSRRFRNLAILADPRHPAAPDVLRQSLKLHHEALRDFKKLAGLE